MFLFTYLILWWWLSVSWFQRHQPFCTRGGKQAHIYQTENTNENINLAFDDHHYILISSKYKVILNNALSLFSKAALVNEYTCDGVTEASPKTPCQSEMLLVLFQIIIISWLCNNDKCWIHCDSHQIYHNWIKIIHNSNSG